MKMNQLNRIVAVVGLILVVATSAPAMTITAYEVPVDTIGNQSYVGSLGMDFNVLQDINIFSLGAFDSKSDGLLRSITVQIYDRNSTATPLAEIVFGVGDTGSLEGGSRFLDLSTPLSLAAGFMGSIVASGYGSDELNYNQGISPLSALNINDGGGLISIVGLARYSITPNIYPTIIDRGPENRYAAGTFKYEAAATVPEPGTLLMLGLGVFGLGVYCRKRNH